MSASAVAPPGAPALARRNWLTLASSAPTRADSRRAFSAAVSSSRRDLRTASAAASPALRRAAAAPAAAVAIGHQGAGGLAALLELGELALQPRPVVLGELGELGLERRDPLGRAVVARVGLSVGLQPFDRDPATRCPLRQLRSGALGGVEPHRDPLGRRARRIEPRGQSLALRAARRQRLLGLLAALGHRGQLGLGRRRRGACRGRRVLGRRQRRAGDAGAITGQRPARLVHLALQPRMQLGRLGLALQRPQPRARLALDVQGAIEVVLRALELELRAAAPLAVLAQPRGLLDQHPAVTRLGGHDRLDAALRDDRVHLLAQAGVREDLDHVREPAARPVDAVLAVAGTIQPAEDRDLADRQVQPAGGVVQHDLDLGLGAGLDAVAAREDHVLHRLPADGQR